MSWKGNGNITEELRKRKVLGKKKNSDRQVGGNNWMIETLKGDTGGVEGGEWQHRMKGM